MTNPKEALEWYERKRVEARAMADRDCNNCKHNKPDGCSRWDCEYELVMSDLIRRQAAIDECDKQYPNIDRQDFKAVINAVPSAEIVLQTPQTYGKSINPNTEIVSDLISRQDAIEAVATVTMSIHLSNVLCDKLLALPSADRPTGVWIWSPKDEDGTVSGCCSNCSFSHLFIGGHTAQYNYCPNCGAKMKGADDED